MACEGFRWIGQDFGSCDECGCDIAEHPGLSWLGRVLEFGEAHARLPLFRLYTTPIDHPEGPYRWEPQGRKAAMNYR